MWSILNSEGKVIEIKHINSTGIGRVKLKVKEVRDPIYVAPADKVRVDIVDGVVIVVERENIESEYDIV